MTNRCAVTEDLNRHLDEQAKDDWKEEAEERLQGEFEADGSCLYVTPDDTEQVDFKDVFQDSYGDELFDDELCELYLAHKKGDNVAMVKQLDSIFAHIDARALTAIQSMME